MKALNVHVSVEKSNKSEGQFLGVYDNKYDK